MTDSETDDGPLRCDVGTVAEGEETGVYTLTCGTTNESVTVRSSGHIGDNEAYHVLDASDDSTHWTSLGKYTGADGAYSADANSPMIRGANNEPYQGEFLEVAFSTPRRVRQYTFQLGRATDPLNQAEDGMPLEWTLLGSDTGAQGTWEAVHVGKTTESALLSTASMLVVESKNKDVIRLRNLDTNTYLAVDSQKRVRLMGRGAQNATWEVDASDRNSMRLKSKDCRGLDDACSLGVDGNTLQPQATGASFGITKADDSQPDFSVRITQGGQYLSSRRPTGDNPNTVELVGDGTDKAAHWFLETTVRENATYVINAVANSGELTTGAALTAHKHYRFLFTKATADAVRIDVLNLFTGAGSASTGPRWVGAEWPACASGDPGDRVITRAIECKHDGEEVAEELCPEDRPATTQTCDQWRENQAADAKSGFIGFMWSYGVYIAVALVILIVLALLTGGGSERADGVRVELSA